MEYDITVKAAPVAIDEIQHHSPTKITKAKVYAAYKQLAAPVVINDISWGIPALNGFPGGYMKDIAARLSAEDFLALMKHKADKRIILHEIVAYYDGNLLQTFTADFIGNFIDIPRGGGLSFNTVVVMDNNNSRTITETFEQRNTQASILKPNNFTHWQKFGEWFSTLN